MATIANNHDLREPLAPAVVSSPARVVRVFIPLVTPFLYGMERAVIELFDALRPEVEPYFLQSNRILERRPPIITEMMRRGFSIQYLPDKTDWERLAKPRSLKHLWRIIVASIRGNLAILKGVRGKDVLYVPGISAASSSLLAAMYCRLTGRRVIHHFHDLGTTNRLFPLWIHLVTDFVHSTKFGFEAVTENLPAISNKRNFVLPLIVEVNVVHQNDADVCSELAAERSVFFIGQIARHKGLDLLIQAFQLVASKFSDVKLHLIGDGQQEFQRELQTQISAVGLGDRVKFWGFREDATRLLQFAHVYVQSSPPSRFKESFCRSVVEAMANGVPIVSFRSGALQEIVVPDATGILCEETATGLANAITRFFADGSFRSACARKARERYENLYSLDNVRRGWIEFLLTNGKCRGLDQRS